MRIKLIVSILVMLLVFLVTFFSKSTCVTNQELLLTNRVIVIDPGHGGIYPGAIANGIREADINLAVALKLRDRLANSGARVVLTRSTDTNVAFPCTSLKADLQARIDVAKASNADMFISLHVNSNPDSNIDGATGYYPAGQSNGLARAILQALVKETHTIDRGIRPENFYVLKNNQVPAALIEMGFLTNRYEAARLVDESYQNQLADGIYEGIQNYFQFSCNN